MPPDSRQNDDTGLAGKAALAAFAVAAILAACGGNGGIDVVSEDERQERQDTLDRKLDGDTRPADADTGDAPEVIAIEPLGVLLEVRDLPCFADEGFVRTAASRVGCAARAQFAGIVSCSGDVRPVVDFAAPDGSGGVTVSTACVSFDDTPEEALDGSALDTQ